MSLVGNLHDLGLGEILQIVSLSRKSGLLSLSHRAKKAELLFRKGEVIRASSTDVPARLGEVLLSRGVVDSATLDRALAVQAGEGFTRLLGGVLTELGVDPRAIEDVVREQIESAVFGLFEWEEGAFEFDIREVAAVPDAARLDPLQFLLDQGVSPQYLAMEGTRILDERRHRGEEPEDDPVTPDSIDFAFNLAEPEAPPQADAAAAAKGMPLVLVDDDPAVLASLEPLLAQRGYAVTAAGGGEEALIAIDTLWADGVRPAVVVDLVMPRMDGSGLFGGLELLELLRANFPGLILLGMTDLADEGAEAAARELEVALIAKPAGSAPDTAFFRALERGLCRDIGDDALDLGAELRKELGDLLTEGPDEGAPEGANGTGTCGAGPGTPEEPLRELSAILEELQHPQLAGGIILLALRFAARFLNRGVVALAGKDFIEGAGEFGIDTGDGLAAARVRSLKIPAGAPSVFGTVIGSGLPFKGTVPQTRWNDYFLEELGGARPVEAFAAPIVSEGKVVAVLYADNLPDHRPVGETEALEIFLSRAGGAMERALLKRGLTGQGQEET